MLKELVMKLPNKAKRLLSIIQDAPSQPVGRSYIAGVLNKKRLTTGDLAYLDVLATNGFIDARKVDSNETPIGYEWQYRFITNEGIDN